MKDLTKVFIEHHIDLITENNFEELYLIALKEQIAVEDLTNTLYKAGIDPLKRMNYVPVKFLYESQESVDGFVIPDGIHSIQQYAFYETDLTEINYKGTRDDWYKIHNHEFINEGSYISKVICSDGIINL